jgi:hypothetical protein
MKTHLLHITRALLAIAVLVAGCSSDPGVGGAGGGTASASSAASTSASGTGGAGGDTGPGGATATASVSASASTSGQSGSASSSNSSTSGTGGVVGPPPGAKRVFITSKAYSGNLALNGGGADGLAGGDKLCQLAADAKVLGGNWHAWLSTTSVNAIDRIADVGPWYRLDGAIVFQNKASIVTSNPLVAINLDEAGVATMSSAWTGTKSTGMADSFRCSEWTSESMNGEGIIGIPEAGSFLKFWTSSSSNPCKLTNSLYCFEQ